MKQGAPVSQESLNNSRAIHSSIVKITQRPGASQAQGSIHHPSSVIGTRSSYPRLHHVVSEPLGGLGFVDLHQGSQIPSSIQQSSKYSHRKHGDKAKQPATRKRVAGNQTLIFSEQQLDDLAAEIFNQIMRRRGSKQRWERSDIKTSKERTLLSLDQFGRWSRVPSEARENIQLVPELSTNKVCKTGKGTSKPCSQAAEKKPEMIHEIEPAITTPCQGDLAVNQLKQEEHVPVAFGGHILDLTKAKEEVKLDAVLVVHKESSETLIEQGGFIKISSEYSLTRPLVCVRFSLMDHLKFVKELHNFIFEPGGKLCEFKSNKNILVQRATTELCRHEIFILKEQDLRSNPFKGGGNSVAQISSKGKMKESKSELHQLLKDLQLWPHHPRPRHHVIHTDLRSRESLYHTPSMAQARVSRKEKFNAEFFTLQTDLSWLLGECGMTRDDPIEERDDPRLKSEYGDQCTRPPDQENHVRRFTLILDRVVLRDDQNLLILGHLGLVRPPECGRRFLVSHEEPALLSDMSCVLKVFTACEGQGMNVFILEGSDLRTNPFKGGGNGVILTSLKMRDSKINNEPAKKVIKTQSHGLYRSFNESASKKPMEHGRADSIQESSLELSILWTKGSLNNRHMDKRYIKDDLGFIMDVSKKVLAEEGPFKPKKWKDKPAWFKLVDFFNLCVILISCKPIRIRIWFS